MALSLLYKSYIAQSEINLWVTFKLFKQTVAALTIAAFCQAVSRVITWCYGARIYAN